MKHLAFYNVQTRAVTATVQLRSDMKPDPSGDPWVEVPPGTAITDPGEWAVGEDGALVFTPRGATVEDVTAELERRLALGFDYDFGDDRGIHRIGTTPADMARWNGEVTPVANAAMNLGQPGKQIGIKTETGPVAITAQEWQEILMHAETVRQPLFQAYFTLKALDPIPGDYAADARWEPGA